MKNMSTLYQHLRSELVPPRVKTMAAAWQVWDSVQDGVGDTIHIDYDGEYGSERVLIVSGRATVVPDDRSPSRADRASCLAKLLFLIDRIIFHNSPGT